MKNKNLLKQNILVIIAMVIAWCFYYFTGYDIYSNFFDNKYSFLMFIIVLYLLFFLPFIFLQHKLKIKNKDMGKANKGLRAVNRIFIVILLLPVFFDLCFEVFYSNYIAVFPFFHSIYFMLTNFNDWGVWLFHSLPYLIVIGLFWWSNKINRNL
jgi:hypothetical protein